MRSFEQGDIILSEGDSPKEVPCNATELQAKKTLKMQWQVLILYSGQVESWQEPESL